MKVTHTTESWSRPKAILLMSCAVAISKREYVINLRERTESRSTQ